MLLACLSRWKSDESRQGVPAIAKPNSLWPCAAVSDARQAAGAVSRQIYPRLFDKHWTHQARKTPTH